MEVLAAYYSSPGTRMEPKDTLLIANSVSTSMYSSAGADEVLVALKGCSVSTAEQTLHIPYEDSVHDYSVHSGTQIMGTSAS